LVGNKIINSYFDICKYLLYMCIIKLSVVVIHLCCVINVSYTVREQQSQYGVGLLQMVIHT